MVILAFTILAAFQWNLPPGFPVPVAGANIQTNEKFELGRRLFYDRRLSWNGSQSCADCHQQRFAFSDGRKHAIGSTGQEHSHNAPSLANVAYSGITLEKQALTPMFNEHPIELGMKHHEKEILARLSDYEPQFRAAFHGRISIANITKALAAFERALISGRSPYDRLVYRDDQSALSPAAWRGMRVFFTARGGCSACHGGFNFASKGAPTLRNVALTGPYMHDGSAATLRDVLDRHSKGLTDVEKSDVLEFLDSLTDREFVTDARFGPP